MHYGLHLKYKPCIIHGSQYNVKAMYNAWFTFSIQAIDISHGERLTLETQSMCYTWITSYIRSIYT